MVTIIAALVALLYPIMCHAANILYVIPFTSKSHYIMLRPIGLELARRGHNVTVITSFEEHEHPPTYYQVMSDDIKIWESFGEPRPNVFTMVDISFEKFHEKILWSGGVGTTENALKSKKVRDFLSKDLSFDVVISELFYQEAFFTLAHKYKAPLVLITTYGNCMKNNIYLRNPTQMATVTNEFAMIRDPKSFVGRLTNLYYSLYELYFWKFWYLEKQKALVKKYLSDLPEPVPTLEELQKNASLVLMNGHFSVDTPIAYLPNFVEVGGLHLSQSDTKLPNDLQKMLDSAKHGVVYVNFGSNVQSSELPDDKKTAFLNVFRRLKQTVVWKWEEDAMHNKPHNLIIRKWLPQKEILAHPNVKVFISHGGLIGTQEAIFNGIPIIGMPIYADQYNNLLQVQEGGYGTILQYHDLNENNLGKIVLEFLTNDSYQKRAKEISARFKDRPMKPLDTAMFWIEFVIRHKGADFAKNPALRLNWFAYNMLDVYAFVLIVSILVFIVVGKLIVLTIKFVFQMTNENRTLQKKYIRKKNN